MNYSIIGEQIQKYRKEAQLTQKELGEALGVSSSAVSQWETGGTPDISLIPSIADRLGVSINVLFGREDITLDNIQEVLPHYIASLPEAKRLKELCHLMWAAVKKENLELNAISESISYNYNVYYGTDQGILLGIDSEKLSCISLFPEPEDGYESLFASDEAYRGLFSTLSKPNALELLKLLHQRPIKHCTSDVVAKRLGIGLEETQTLLAEFSKLQLVSELELETESGDTKVYIVNALGTIVPFLYTAHMIVEKYGDISLLANKREVPLLRKAAKTGKGVQNP
ncbi:MAG: helix-turn-helix transcriptional regulator [Lachnospiraceae bacterium]|nr:helix-turn-helix transcriptional regulator [Lachnospiraceae bacterium]